MDASGCEEPVPVMVVVGEVEIDRCPRSMVDPEDLDVVDLWRARENLAPLTLTEALLLPSRLADAWEWLDSTVREPPPLPKVPRA